MRMSGQGLEQAVLDIADKSSETYRHGVSTK
jgi:hypothetical protein